MYDSAEDAQAHAAVAVEAEMLSLRREESPEASAPARMVEVARWTVTRSMRGPLAPAQIFETRTTLSTAMCGTQLADPLSASNHNGRVRKRWLLFFHDAQASGVPYFIATCSRSRPNDP
ncbi:hypothetical protein [Xanthomonas bundabergensis]|uniref:hypothetical protein n=1 Tax=Xanthomonas bundabergensis TaxID=3160842 RepID=UPI003511F201